MTLNAIKKKNNILKKLSGTAVFLTCLLVIQTTLYFGMFMSVLTLMLIRIFRNEAKQKETDKITFSSTQIMCYVKRSYFACFVQKSPPVLMVIPMMMLWLFSLDAVDEQIKLPFTLALSVLMLIFISTEFLQYRYSFVAFEEGFSHMNENFYYKDIKKVQLIKTKKNAYIVEMNTGKRYISVTLDENNLNIIRPLLIPAA